MQTDFTDPDRDDDDLTLDDMLADEAVDAVSEPEPPSPDRRGLPGDDDFKLLRWMRFPPKFTPEWEAWVSEISDSWAASMTSAAASNFVLSDGSIAQLKYGSWGRSTVIKFTEPFDVDVIAHLTPAPADNHDHTSRLIKLFKHWNRAADEQSMPSLLIELKAWEPQASRGVWWEAAAAHAAGRAASRAVHAALQAREAVIREDQEIGRAAVANYVSQWLGLKPTAAMVEAAGNALLQAPLDPHDPSPDSAVVKRLRSATFRQRRAWRPIGETWLRGRRVDYLDRPLRLHTDKPMLTVASTLGAEDVHDVDLDGWQDHRVPRVLTKLRDDERDVAMAYAHDSGCTWAAAARACGHPETFGERVRRKLLRLGKDLTSRLTAQHTVPQAA